jgi:hypothetical protein
MRVVTRFYCSARFLDLVIYSSLHGIHDTLADFGLSGDISALTGVSDAHL